MKRHSEKQYIGRYTTPCKLADAVKCISLDHSIIALVSGSRENASSLIEKNCQLKSMCFNIRNQKNQH